MCPNQFKGSNQNMNAPNELPKDRGRGTIMKQKLLSAMVAAAFAASPFHGNAPRRRLARQGRNAPRHAQLLRWLPGQSLGREALRQPRLPAGGSGLFVGAPARESGCKPRR